MNTEHLLGLHMEARRVKEHWWYDHQEPDPPPMLCVRWQGQDEMKYVDITNAALMVHAIHQMMPNMPMCGIEIPPDDQPAGSAVLYITLSALRDGIGVPGIEKPPPKGTLMEEVWLNDEGYTHRDGSKEVDMLTLGEALALRHGDLEADFRRNPMSDVIEEMTTYIVRTDPLGLAEWGRAVSMFHKDDGGVIVWHEPTVVSSDEPPEGFDIYLEVMKAFVIREALS